MKTPQRNFVVEFKSGRRQTKTVAKSIWGDTDFKALTREVEEKASPLFDPNAAPTTPDEHNEMAPAAPLRSRSTGKPKAVDDAAPLPVDAASAEASDQKGVDFPTAEVHGQSQESEPAPQPQAPSKDICLDRTETIGLRPGKRAPDTNRGATAGHTPVSYLFSFVELDALDAENRRLKRLFVIQLRQENAQLRRMLERFDVVLRDRP